ERESTEEASPAEQNAEPESIVGDRVRDRADSAARHHRVLRQHRLPMAPARQDQALIKMLSMRTPYALASEEPPAERYRGINDERSETKQRRPHIEQSAVGST